MPTTKTMTKIVPALTARTQFGQILRRVKQNKERFVVDKRGEPQAVIMSVEDYLRKFVKRPRRPSGAKRRRKDSISFPCGKATWRSSALAGNAAVPRAKAVLDTNVIVSALLKDGGKVSR